MIYNRRSIMTNAWRIRRATGANMSAALKEAWAIAKGDKTDELKLAQMIGSEKQIAWATDIITGPYNRMIANAEHNEKIGGSYHSEMAAIRRRAAEMYKKSYEENSQNMTRASWVIDHRSYFGAIMEECVRMSIEGTSFHLYDFGQNF